MKVADSILSNLLVESQAARRRVGAVSQTPDVASKRLRGKELKFLNGSDSSRLRSLLANLAERSRDLVKSQEDSAFASSREAKVSTTRPSVATAEVVKSGGRARSTKIGLKVSQLAQGQTNQGQAVSSIGTGAIQSGTNTFTISLGSRSAVSVSVDIGQSDTNLQALEKVTEAINAADADISAELVTDSDAGTSYISISADATGTRNAFTVADVSGNVISATGVSSVTTAAQDAKYVLDGRALTSSSNSILVDDGRISITLKRATGPTGGNNEAGVIIEVGPDPVSAAAADLADAVNNLQAFLKDTGTAGARGISRVFRQIVSDSKSALEDIGLKVDAEGNLQLDRTLFADQLSKDPSAVEETLGAEDGAATELYAASAQLLSQVSRDLVASSGSIVSYGFAAQGGLLAKASILGRGSQIDFVI